LRRASGWLWTTANDDLIRDPDRRGRVRSTGLGFELPGERSDERGEDSESGPEMRTRDSARPTGECDRGPQCDLKWVERDRGEQHRRDAAGGATLEPNSDRTQEEQPDDPGSEPVGPGDGEIGIAEYGA
jgi:hypothetical protein